MDPYDQIDIIYGLGDQILPIRLLLKKNYIGNI